MSLKLKGTKKVRRKKARLWAKIERLKFKIDKKRARLEILEKRYSEIPNI